MARADDHRVALRVARFESDGARVVAALSSGPWGDVLQFAGDALLLALAQSVDAASGVARNCDSELRKRSWDGDDHLADQLEVALGERPAPMLRPLPVDLEVLAAIFEGDPTYGDGRIDVQTGEVWPGPVPCGESRDGYRDMEVFIDTIADAGRADRLSIAISGRAAFRRFKDVLAGWPGELERWFVFSGERQRGRARVWLAEAGYAPTPRRGSIAP
jgi:hypothetical protein